MADNFVDPAAQPLVFGRLKRDVDIDLGLGLHQPSSGVIDELEVPVVDQVARPVVFVAHGGAAERCVDHQGIAGIDEIAIGVLVMAALGFVVSRSAIVLSYR